MLLSNNAAANISFPIVDLTDEIFQISVLEAVSGGKFVQLSLEISVGSQSMKAG